VVFSVVEVGERRAREEDEEVERKKKVYGQWVMQVGEKKGGNFIWAYSGPLCLWLGTTHFLN
jgi:hypothetical protein